MTNEIIIFTTNSTLFHTTEKVLSDYGLSNIPIYLLAGEQALVQARLEISHGTRVIIARGGTKQYLKRYLDVPIIELRHSFLGVYQSMQKLKREFSSIAVIGYADFAATIRKYNQVMEDDVKVYEVFSEEQFETAVRQARKDNAQVFVGGIQIEQICLRDHLQYRAVYSDELEVRQAIDEAFAQLKLNEEKSLQTDVLSGVLNSISEGIVYIDSSGVIERVNDEARRMIRLDKGDCIPSGGILEKYFKQALEGKPTKDKLFSIDAFDLVSSCIPIVSSGLIAGAVFSLQEQQSIKNIDTKIRKRIAIGHVAKSSFSDIVGRSKKIQETIETAKLYAKSDSTVLITGETGVGKELFAQGIHNFSNRAQSSFVAVNCAALSRDMLESELFGYVKGAFTGASSEGKEGIFELAHTGTVLLDEISEIPSDVQAKLLRVLQEREVTRLGDVRVIPVDVRVIATSNRNLREEVEAGRFRRDLFYRICVLELEVPPLRERGDDIELLFSSFMADGAKLSDKALETLKSYDWPGNVRQLSNIAERLRIRCASREITEDDKHSVLPYWKERMTPVSRKGEEVLARGRRSVTRSELEEALDQCSGDRTKTASMLGISVPTLWRQMKKLNLI